MPSKACEVKSWSHNRPFTNSFSRIIISPLTLSSSARWGPADLVLCSAPSVQGWDQSFSFRFSFSPKEKKCNRKVCNKKGTSEALGRWGLENILGQGVTSCSRLEPSTGLGRASQSRCCCISGNTCRPPLPADSPKLSSLWCADVQQLGPPVWQGGRWNSSPTLGNRSSWGSLLLRLQGKALLCPGNEFFLFMFSKIKMWANLSFLFGFTWGLQFSCCFSRHKTVVWSGSWVETFPIRTQLGGNKVVCLFSPFLQHNGSAVGFVSTERSVWWFAAQPVAGGHCGHKIRSEAEVSVFWSVDFCLS